MKCNTDWVVKNEIKDDLITQELIEIILKNRGVEDTESFLNPDISKIPSFEKLFDSVKAAKKIVQTVKEKKKIIIYGDYDVDGISGVALLWSFLYFEFSEFLNIEKKDLKILPYIPDRISEGYGLSRKSLDKISKDGVDLIITVDCGIRDKDLINEYKNIEFIVTDHHIPPDDILDDLSYILVHQLYPGKEYPYPSVCGAFVAFLLVLAIKKVIGMDSSFENNRKYLDLVALPTITDIMPLQDVNRIVTKYGLETIRQGGNLGLVELADRANVNIEDVKTYHLGYIIGPRLNASGRIGNAMDALRILTTKDDSQAKEISYKLNNLNYERQNLTSSILNEAREKILSKDLNKLIFVKGSNWNEGVIGLVAGKLQEEFYRPVIVVSETEDEIKGSARSVAGLNITEVIEIYGEFLEKFGGHAQAAGFTVKKDKLEKFEEAITNYLEDNFDDNLLKRKIEIDSTISIKNLNMELIENLSKLEPFGYGNKKPVFLLREVIVVEKKVLGKDQNHMKLEIKDDGLETIEAIMFDCVDSIEKINIGDTIDIAGSAGINEWNGSKKIQFEVKDWKTCNKE